MKETNGQLSLKPQLNFRVEPKIKAEVVSEIKRQGRKRDFVAEKVWKHFLSLKVAERDAICCKSFLFFLLSQVGFYLS